MTPRKYRIFPLLFVRLLFAAADHHTDKEPPEKTQYPDVRVEVERSSLSRGNESINLEICVGRLRNGVSGCDVAGARGVIEFFATTDPCSIDPDFHDVLKEIKTLVEYNQNAPNTCGTSENEPQCSGELSERCRPNTR